MLVEGAVLRHDRAFEGRYSLRNMLQTRSASEDQLELLLIGGDFGDFRHDSTMLLRHFDRIMNRADRLLFERARSTIPKLERNETGVVDGGSLPTAGSAECPNGKLASVREAGSRIMAKSTGDGIVLGQARVEVELLA